MRSRIFQFKGKVNIYKHIVLKDLTNIQWLKTNKRINRMNVIPELFDFEQFWDDYGFNVINMIEDKTPNSEIHEEIGDLLKPFAR